MACNMYLTMSGRRDVHDSQTVCECTLSIRFACGEFIYSVYTYSISPRNQCFGEFIYSVYLYPLVINVLVSLYTVYTYIPL